jgi:polysaccharide biosynthesis protein PelF
MTSDVCLVLEGSYPYVRGGVAAWVQELVCGLPDVTFSVLHLAGEEGPPRAAAFERPANLAELTVVETDPDRIEPEANVVDRLSEAAVYHALSTGLAGLTAAEAAAARGRPFLLTEHGLAWKEARLGIFGCKPHVSGCKPHVAPEPKSGRDAAELRREWAQVVERSARSAYARADTITSVCGANARLQAGQGADERRLRVIANAVRGPAIRAGRAAGALHDPLVGLVGRVVAIKDVETFLAACRIVADELPEARFAVVGPLDHEPEYASMCLELAASTLGERIVFTGETDPGEWYARLDVVALTSLSEAQPLVLLEAMAAGVPVVAPAVGGCVELLRGGAGVLTPVRDPRATARAVLAVSQDGGLRERLVRAGRERVRREHSVERMLSSYRRVYERALDRRPA